MISIGSVKLPHIHIENVSVFLTFILQIAMHEIPFILKSKQIIKLLTISS